MTAKPSSAVSVTEEHSGVVGAEEIKSINDRDEAAKEEQQKAGAETKTADDKNTNETSKEEMMIRRIKRVVVSRAVVRKRNETRLYVKCIQ